MAEIREITSGLRFPEGPIWMEDGSIILVEIERGTLSRVSKDGRISVVADLGGGPNGAAIGPNGKIYVCNDGGFEWHVINGLLFPGLQPANYTGGSIQVVDPETGKFEDMYRECNGNRLCGPNDIVFDKHGGFWFTDHGKNRERERDRTGVYYAKADGSMIREVIFPIADPNGIGLSPAGDRLYVAETWTGRVWSWEVRGPGEIVAGDALGAPGGGTLLVGLPGFQLLDSMAIEANGNVCVATLVNGGISSISPDGSVEFTPMPDPLTTNICFGGKDLRTAYVTLSGTGKLVSTAWPRPGLKLAYTA
jgi:gluconolactonase